MSFKIPDTPEELFRQGGQHFSNMNKWIPFILGIIIVLLVVVQSFYKIETGDVGVVRRFGEYKKTTQPGLHWKFPLIDQLNIVQVDYQYKEEFGFRTLQAGVNTKYSSQDFSDESLMLTGDNNVLDVTWTVEFKVKDPVHLLFNLRNPQDTVRDVSESMMRQVIGDSSVSESLTTRRNAIGQEVQEKMQIVLDSYKSGIQINSVNLQDVNPPMVVRKSFNEVNQAKQEKEQTINKAKEAKNRVIPQAIGMAEQTISEAEGYALERVSRAEGDASKFVSVWKAYKSTEDVTRKRLYFETLSQVMPKVGKIYVFEPKANSLLPLIHLNEGDQK